jgi:peptide deformylase
MQLPILEFPDPFLKKAVPPVAAVSAEILAHLDNMLETMYAENGVGLAATQVGIPLQLVVIDASEQHDSPLFLINPSIIDAQEDILSEEGCLSFPGVYVKVPRKATVTVSFLNRAGETEQLTADGLLSICLQHEIDHLKGITFFDYLSPLKKSFALKKLKKQSKFSHET